MKLLVYLSKIFIKPYFGDELIPVNYLDKNKGYSHNSIFMIHITREVFKFTKA